MRFSAVHSLAAAASMASAHTIMQAINGLEMGKGIYMPDNDNTVRFPCSIEWCLPGALIQRELT